MLIEDSEIVEKVLDYHFRLNEENKNKTLFAYANIHVISKKQGWLMIQDYRIIADRMLKEGLFERPSNDSDSNSFRITHYANNNFRNEGSYIKWVTEQDEVKAKKAKYARWKEVGEAWFYRLWWLPILISGLAFVISVYTLFKGEIETQIKEWNKILDPQEKVRKPPLPKKHSAKLPVSFHFYQSSLRNFPI